MAGYFHLMGPLLSYDEVETSRKISCVIILPSRFGNLLYQDEGAPIQIIADASDPNTATTVNHYLNTILQQHVQEMNAVLPAAFNIIIETRHLYNEEQNGSLNFIPGVIALIFMIVSTALTSVAVVREKESGTMEVLLVSPFKPFMVLIAKAIPYLVLSLIGFIVILLGSLCWMWQSREPLLIFVKVSFSLLPV